MFCLNIHSAIVTVRFAGGFFLERAEQGNEIAVDPNKIGLLAGNSELTEGVRAVVETKGVDRSGAVGA